MPHPDLIKDYGLLLVTELAAGDLARAQGSAEHIIEASEPTIELLEAAAALAAEAPKAAGDRAIAEHIARPFLEAALAAGPSAERRAMLDP